MTKTTKTTKTTKSKGKTNVKASTKASTKSKQKENVIVEDDFIIDFQDFSKIIDTSISNVVVDNIITNIDKKLEVLCKETNSKLYENRCKATVGTKLECSVSKSIDSFGDRHLTIDCLYVHGLYRNLIHTSLFKDNKINRTSRGSADLRNNTKLLLGNLYDRLLPNDADGYQYTRDMLIIDGQVVYKIQHKVNLRNTDTLQALCEVL